MRNVKHRTLAQFLVSLLALFLGAPPAAFAQLTPSQSVLALKTYTTAGLPTSGVADGQMARITDGDAAGSIIAWDSANRRWVCYQQLTLHEINIACPPYNAAAAARDNYTAINAALIDLQLCASSWPYCYIRIPIGEYRVGTALVYAPSSGELNFFMRGDSQFYSRLVFDNSGVGLTIHRSNGRGNLVEISNMQLRGGAGRPTDLLVVDHTAQVRLDHVYLNDFYTRGVNLVNNDHQELTNGYCVANASADADSECIHLFDPARTNITGWKNEPNGSQISWFVGIGGFTIAASVTVAHNSGAKMKGVLKYDNATPTWGLHVIDNQFSQLLEGVLINVRGTKEGVEIRDNTFRHKGSPSLGEKCIHVQGMYGATIEGNTCDGFHDGIFSLELHHSEVRGNVLRDIDNDCIAGWYADAENTWDGNIIEGGCGGKILNTNGAGRTGGGNVLQNTVLDSTTQTTWLAGGMLATSQFTLSDAIYLRKAKQVITTDDGGSDGGAVGTNTVNPFYEDLVNDCNDVDGCDLALGTANAKTGMKVRVQLAASPGATNRITGDAGSTWDTITINDVFEYVFQNEVWQKIN